MKTRDYEINKSKKIGDALFDKRISHVEFRIYSLILYLESTGINWKVQSWREIGEDLGDMHRATIAKTFKKLQELEYLLLTR